LCRDTTIDDGECTFDPELFQSRLANDFMKINKGVRIIVLHS
jgi:hypothetical protein